MEGARLEMLEEASVNHANFVCYWLYLFFNMIVTFCSLAKF